MGMGYQEYDRFISFLGESREVQQLFLTALGVVVAYDPVLDTIFFSDQQHEEQRLAVKV
jgi:hypothetical protein